MCKYSNYINYIVYAEKTSSLFFIHKNMHHVFRELI